jgi:CxxC motif-containing protein (DUF1111 family)
MKKKIRSTPLQILWQTGLLCCLPAVFFAAMDGDGDTTRFAGEEWYAGGRNGTVFIANEYAYQEPMPFVFDDDDRLSVFIRGKRAFERYYSSEPGYVYSGLGPVHIRESCISCHPGHGGRGQRRDRYDADDENNGYLLVIYDPADPELALASQFFTGMVQTRAVHPYKPPVRESGISIRWLEYTDEWGNRYPDGTPYGQGTDHEGTLIYPRVEIAQDAILFPDFDMSRHAAAVEASIGLWGVGLIDAIADEDLRAQYEMEQSRRRCRGIIGPDIEETDSGHPFPGVHPGRFTYLCSRATLDNGPGANGIWNITNVTAPHRTHYYITEAYARAMAGDADVQRELNLSEPEIRAHLTSRTLEPEIYPETYANFMFWHRTLGVPAARLDSTDRQMLRGKELFYGIGCTMCHKPSWTTRAHYAPAPEMSGQKIYPYTDLLRHDLDMHEPGRVRVCRTTPLWGRGLMEVTAGHTDMLHDLRARSYEEAILWHGGEAKPFRERFRRLPAADREALIRFLKAI